MSGLVVLVVDDEQPAREDLAWSLQHDPRVASTLVAADATEALRVLRDGGVDAVFLDVQMPGLDGVELARVLSQFATPPAVVFVTAFEQHAVAAFDLDAADYLLKPVRSERLAHAITKVIGRPEATARESEVNAGSTTDAADATPGELSVLPVESGGRLRYVACDDVRYVEAAGDYARVHVGSSSYLVRIPMAALESKWSCHGFVRIHRRYLVGLRHVSELRTAANGGVTVQVADATLPVSRRSSRELRDRMADAARSGILGVGLRS